jgi:hypothetical protein
MMTEGLPKSPLHATDEAGVEQVDGILHDETFELDGIEHDVAAQTITIPVRRQFHGGPEQIIDSGLVWKTYEKEWLRSRLTIRDVRSWKAEHDQGINNYSFCSWHVFNGQLVIECNEALVLTFNIGRVDVKLEDLGFKGKARIKRGPMGVETSWSTVYE